MNNLLHHIKFHQKHKKSLLDFFVFLILLFPVFVFAQENKLPGDKRSIDIILMLDKSESLDIESGITQYALPAAKYLVDFIDVYQKKSDFNIRLAFILFGESVDGFFPLQKLKAGYKEKILEEIKTGKTKKTDFVPPFRKAMHLFTNSKESGCLIFLFSDGVPDLQGKEFPPESDVLNYFNTSGIKEVIRILTTRMNVDIEIIGFNDRLYGSNRTKEGNPNFIKKLWDRLLEGNSGSSFHSTGTEKLDPTKVVHKILEESFYGESPEWSKLEKEELVIDLEPFLEWAVFTIIKENQGDRVDLKKSKGEPLESDIIGKDGRYLIYYLRPPIEEKLIVKLISGEDVWYKINKRYPEIRFELEKKTSNRDRDRLLLLAASEGELELSCSIFKGDNIVIEKNINLEFDGKNMKYDGKGIYFHKIELSPNSGPIVLKPKIEAFYNKKIIPLRKDITEFAVESRKFVKKSDDFLIWVIGSIGTIFFIAFLTLLFISKRHEKRKVIIKEKIKGFEKQSKNLSNVEIVRKGDSLLDTLKTEFGTCEKEYFKSFEDKICIMFSVILKAKKEQTEGLILDDFLPSFDSIKNSSGTLINCLAKVLWKEKWDNAAFDEIISGIYKIIDRFDDPVRILFHIAESSKHKAGEIIKSMTEIYDIRDEELQQNLRHYLSQIRKAYQNFQDTEKLGVEGYNFFDSLSKFLDSIENTPYPEKIDYPDNSNLEIECWKNSIELLGDLNYLDKLDYEEALKRIRNSIKNCPEKIKGPETKIISSILKKWYFELNSVSLEPVEIELSFAPELAIREEMIKDPSLSLFSILIKNNSGGYAYDVHITVNSKRGGIGTVKIGKVPKHSSCITKIFKIHDIEQTEITASYKYLKKESKGKIVFLTKTTNLYPNLEYVIKKGSSNANEECSYSLEPYSPGDIFVNRENDISTIEKVIMSKTSQILAVFGMRRVGKTSLINFLMQSFSEKHPNIKCITIPSSIFNRKSPWENEEFLGVLARRIFRESSISNYVERLSKKWHYQNIDNMELNSFWEFMDDLMIVMNNQKLVIFFDDADYFEKKIKGYEKELFPGLKDLLELFNDIIERKGENKGDFNIIFFGCNNVLGDSWSKSFIKKEKISELKLFEKNDVSKIAHTGTYKIPFNALSLEYLMRITGGHPGLTQYVCMLLRNELSLQDMKFQTVPLSILHKVIKKFIIDNYGKMYCRRIVRFSLPHEEGLFFVDLLEKVNSFSLEIDSPNLNEEKLQGLTKYQFLEVRSDFNQSKILRIGIFKLFSDKSFLVKDSFEGIVG